MKQNNYAKQGKAQINLANNKWVIGTFMQQMVTLDKGRCANRRIYWERIPLKCGHVVAVHKLVNVPLQVDLVFISSGSEITLSVITHDCSRSHVRLFRARLV